MIRFPHLTRLEIALCILMAIALVPLAYAFSRWLLGLGS